MAFNVLSGTINALDLVASGSFSGSYVGDGSQLENVQQFELQNAGDQRVLFYKLINGTYQLNANTGFTFNSSAETLLINGPKVGIGTASPETPLHVQSGSAGTIAPIDGALLVLESNYKPKIHFQSPGAYGGSIIFGSPTDNDEGQIDYDNGSDRFLFKTGGNTKMTILGDNVGIGTASPAAKLEIVGNLKISTSLTASTARLTGLALGTATTASFLALDSNNNIVLTSSAGGSGGGGGDISYSRRFISSHATASVSNTLIGISASAPLELRLPSAAGYAAGQYFTVKDEAGNCNNFNITILASGSQTIDGVSSILLESPYAAVNLYTDGASKFFVY